MGFILIFSLIIAICINAGKVGMWCAFVLFVLFFTGLATSEGGMIWPWTKKKDDAGISPWSDDGAEDVWHYLIAARTVAQDWYFSRWRDRTWIAVAAWLGILIAVLSGLVGLDEIWLVFSPQGQWPKSTIIFLFWAMGVLALPVLGVAFFGRSRNKKEIVDLIQQLHGATYLWSQWHSLCGITPLPFAFWRYARILIPIGTFAYHHFLPIGAPSAITAVLSVFMMYFGYSVLDISFDTLAALNGIEFCPCRSVFLARMVWECGFLMQHHKPLWAKVLESLGF